MQLSIPIRPFAAKDFAAVCELDTLCFPEGIAYPPEEIAYFLSRRGTFCMVATGDGRVVAWILGHASPGAHGVGRVITIDVHPDYRRRKFGDALMTALEAELRQAGCRKMRLEVATNNLGAQQFYERRGYAVQRTLHNYYADGSDAFLMEKVW